MTDTRNGSAPNALACCWLSIMDESRKSSAGDELAAEEQSMTRLMSIAAGIATVVMVAASATMNATALSSFGRTALEIALLIAVSLASDTVKAILPVVIARAVILRAWLHGGLAALLLAAVIGLSIFSGFTFVAMTKEQASAAHQGHAEHVAALRADLARIEKRLAGLADLRAAAVMEEEVKAQLADRRWSATKECSDMGAAAGAATRQFCAGVFKLRGDIAGARERDRLLGEQQRLRERLAAARSAPARDVDAAPRVIAEMLGIAVSLPRMAMSVGLAIVLELGSVVLVLLAAGPTLAGWARAERELRAKESAKSLPPQPDREFWKSRGHGVLAGAAKGAGHGDR